MVDVVLLTDKELQSLLSNWMFRFEKVISNAGSVLLTRTLTHQESEMALRRWCSIDCAIFYFSCNDWSTDREPFGSVRVPPTSLSFQVSNFTGFDRFDTSLERMDFIEISQESI